MEKRFTVVFDEVVQGKLQKLITDGPAAGKLLDNHVWLYEMKSKRPPLRLYFYHQQSTGKIIIFECEMKTSEKKQKETIGKLKHKLTKFLNLFLYTLFSLNSRGTQ